MRGTIEPRVMKKSCDRLGRGRTIIRVRIVLRAVNRRVEDHAPMRRIAGITRDSRSVQGRLQTRRWVEKQWRYAPIKRICADLVFAGTQSFRTSAGKRGTRGRLVRR